MCVCNLAEVGGGNSTVMNYFCTNFDTIDTNQFLAYGTSTRACALVCNSPDKSVNSEDTVGNPAHRFTSMTVL